MTSSPPPGTAPVSPLARVGDLGELAALLPYLMGFVPHESLVCLGLGRGDPRRARVGLTARVDLADVADPRGGPALVRGVFGALERSGARRAVAFVVSEADTVDEVVVDRLLAAAAGSGVPLDEIGWHRGDRCFALTCDEPACCPPEGFPVDPACAPALTAAYAGVRVEADRAAVEAEFAATGRGDDLDPLVAAHEEAMLRADLDTDDPAEAAATAATAVIELARTYDEHAEDPRALPPLPDEVVAACLAALGHVAVRDAVWLEVDSRAVDGGGLWLELARRAPSPYEASPLFLLGWRSWRCGDGVRATLAAERADAVPGGYSAARLLLDAVASGMDPARVPLLSAS